MPADTDEHETIFLGGFSLSAATNSTRTCRHWARHGRARGVYVLCAAAFVIMVAMISTPAVWAQPGHPGGVTSSPQESPSLAARAMATRMRAELSLLPRETRSGRCSSTEMVQGLGRACRSRDGLFKMRHGSSFVTSHGFDAPPPAAFNTYLSGSTTAISGASANDVKCVNTTTTKYTQLVYAYPSNGVNNYALIAPLLRQEAYKLSAFLNAESRSVDATKIKRMNMACDESGVPTVLSLQLPTSTASDSFTTIVNDMASLGYGGTFSLAAKDRYLVFYDASIGGGIAGTGHLFEDDAAASWSANNNGGMVAVEFNWGGVPHFETLLHEAGHNMGAVQPSAPNNSGTMSGGDSAGHCTDGSDVMCYADGGSNAYDPDVCSIRVFDCNRDDYFNPSPAPGTYLANNWNVASTYNEYLQHASTNDVSAPSAPDPVTVSGVSNSAVALSWDPSIDDVGVAGYRIWRVEGSDTTLLTTVASRRKYVVGSLEASTAYSFGVSAVDAQGNQSAITSVNTSTNATTDSESPTVPSNPTTSSTFTRATISWAEASDNVGVGTYRVYLLNPTRLVAEVSEIRHTITSLKPGTSYGFAVTSRDRAGQESPMMTSTVTTAADTTAPATPTRPTVSSRTRTSIGLTWRATTDNVQVQRYRLYVWRKGAWRQVVSLPTSQRRYTLKKLMPGRVYAFRIRAVDSSGNVSWWSSMRVTSTRR
jgi:hypothetical protein